MTMIQRRAAMMAGASLLLARAAAAQGPQPQPAEIIKDRRVESFDMPGPEGAAPWRILVGRPSQPPPPTGYPVLFLLDGNATFPLAWHAQERACAAGCAKPMLLVGVGYPITERFDFARRYFDLTPETPVEYFQGRRETRTGGQDAFLDMICGPLREEVSRRAPVDRSQSALFGHSLGGLCVLHALFTRPEQFATYIAADPSIWWNNRSILQEQAAFLAGVRATGGRLKPSIRLLIENSGMRRPPANNPPPTGAAPAGTSPAAPAPQPRMRMDGPGGRESAIALKAVGGLEVGYRLFAGESHGSMIPGSVQDALAFCAGNAFDAP